MTEEKELSFAMRCFYYGFRAYTDEEEMKCKICGTELEPEEEEQGICLNCQSNIIR